MKVRFLVCLVISLLWGCSTSPVRQFAWSENLPAQQRFSEPYHQDHQNAQAQSLEQYLTWVERFYQGWEVYPTGWNQISQDLTAKIADASEKAAMQARMQHLGVAIAAEWAKDNSVRRITTRHVAIWGNALQKSVERAEVTQILDRVEDDVDNLLNNRMTADVITENRFYAVEDVLNEIN